MFNDGFGLTAAVLEGRKVQTRRIPTLTPDDAQYLNDAFDFDLRESVILDRYAKYKVGEAVAIAQSYATILEELETPANFSCMEAWEAAAGKRAEMAAYFGAPGFSNKMFVQASEMPHQIIITALRMERLQDISVQDCIKEGIRKWEDEKEYLTDKTVRKSVDELKAAGYDAYAIHGCWDCFTSPREAYATLIDKVSGKGTWKRNPWVMVYNFKLVK